MPATGSCLNEGLTHDATFDINGTKCDNGKFYKCLYDGTWQNLSAIPTYGNQYTCSHTGLYFNYCIGHTDQYANSGYATLLSYSAKLCAPDTTTPCTSHVVDGGFRCVYSGILQTCISGTGLWSAVNPSTGAPSYMFNNAMCADNLLYQDYCWQNVTYTNQTTLTTARPWLCYPIGIPPTTITYPGATTTTTTPAGTPTNNAITDLINNFGGSFGIPNIVIWLLLMLVVGGGVLYYTGGEAHGFLILLFTEVIMIVLGAVMGMISAGIIIILIMVALGIGVLWARKALLGGG
jgi:hypothetical protein